MSPEDQLQIAVVDYLTLVLPKDIEFNHCPNGGNRNMIEAKKLKRMGTRAGWPYIQFLRNGRVSFIELKRPDWRDGRQKRKAVLSNEQKYLRERLVKQGCPYAVCRSIDEVAGTLKGWGMLK